MRTLFLTALFASLTMIGVSQTTAYTASFTGTKADLDKAIDAKSISFSVAKVTSMNDVDYLKQRSANYVKEITITVSYDKVSGLAAVSAGLDDNQKDMKWLFRYFLNANITQVQMDGKTVSTPEFFKPWL